MASKVSDSDWKVLLQRIASGKCTPFLGAGACAGVLPLGRDIAQQLSTDLDFPIMNHCEDLPHVSQYIAIKFGDNSYPKEKVKEMLLHINPPDFDQPDEPHAVLADLPLPIYITTNYDDFMFKALISKKRNAKQVLCPWTKFLRLQKKEEWAINFEPTPEKPVVFHLHGHLKVVESLVLTEDDYLDFLLFISKNDKLIHSSITGALAGTSLLFLGYSLADWDFRVLFRSIVQYLEISQTKKHVSVQLVPGASKMSDDELEKMREYLGKYFGKQEITVFWGTCREFADELRQKWEDFSHGK